jgi:predicted aspartyl protease
MAIREGIENAGITPVPGAQRFTPGRQLRHMRAKGSRMTIRILAAGMAALILVPTARAAPSFADGTCLAIQHGDGGTPVITARVNRSAPLAFILDTGSSGTTIDPATARRLALARDAVSETAQGMGGGVTVHYFRVASFDAGPLALRDVALPSIEAPELTSHPIVGLAGTDLFGDRLARWTPGSGCVTITPGGTPPAGTGWRRVEVNWIQPWKVMLPIRIGGVDGWAMLDTGAHYTTVNPAFASAAGIGPARLKPAGSIAGIDGRDLPLSAATIADVRVGAWQWRSAQVRVGDLPVFGRLSMAGDRLAILGMDWLAARGFAVDYKTRTVWQRRGTARAAAQ